MHSLVKKTCALSCGLMLSGCLYVGMSTQAYAQNAQARVEATHKVKYEGSVWEQGKEHDVAGRTITANYLSLGNKGQAYLLEVYHDGFPKEAIEAANFEQSSEVNLGQRLLLHAAQEMERPQHLSEDEFNFAVQLALWSTKRESGSNLDASHYFDVNITNQEHAAEFLSLVQKLYKISEGQNPYVYKLSTEKQEWTKLNDTTLIKRIGKLEGGPLFKGRITSPSPDLVICDKQGKALSEIGPGTELYLTKKKDSLVQGMQTFTLTPLKDLPHYEVYSDASQKIKLVSDTPIVKPQSTEFSIDVSFEQEALTIEGLSDLTILEHKAIPDMHIRVSPEGAKITEKTLPKGISFDETKKQVTGIPLIDDWGKTEEKRKLPLELVAQNPEDKQTSKANSHITVLRDTDKDGISDIDDVDDDNDGFSDEEEIQAGTDPKDKNSFPQKTDLPKEELKLKAPQDTRVIEHKSMEPLKIKVSPLEAHLSVSYIPKGISLSKENQNLYGEPVITDWKKDEEVRVYSPKIRAEHKDMFKEDQFKLSVLRDTDKDGKPDIEDPDDDNDGYTDEFEIKSGTDPKDPKSYPDNSKGTNLKGNNTKPKKSSDNNDFWSNIGLEDPKDDSKKGQDTDTGGVSDISALPKTSDTKNYLIAPALTLGFVSWLVVLRRFLNFS